MLSAVAMVLAYQASDTRNPPAVRARAQRRLLELPGHVLCCGVAASYSEECLWFVRLLDVHDHDPALTARELRNFIGRVETLFLEGHIFVEPEGVGAGITDTCLNIALRQAKEPRCPKFESHPKHHTNPGQVDANGRCEVHSCASEQRHAWSEFLGNRMFFYSMIFSVSFLTR